MKNYNTVIFVLLILLKQSVVFAGGIAFYNQTYQENFQKDSLTYITLTAHNSLILLDPFDGIETNIINTLKANHNQQIAYIRIGTGEDWRADCKQMKCHLLAKQ